MGALRAENEKLLVSGAQRRPIMFRGSAPLSSLSTEARANVEG
jgi:hypothetical protein